MAITEQQTETKIDRIRELMEDGETRTADTVAEATQLDRQEVAVALATETRHGRLTRVKQGVYRKTVEKAPKATAPKSTAPKSKTVKRTIANPTDRQTTPVQQPVIVLQIMATMEDGSLLCRRGDGVVCMTTINELGRTL